MSNYENYSLYINGWVYYIILVFIHLNDPLLNEARVSHRIVDGGHSVPPEKIHSRIPRTWANVKAAVPLCDEVHVLDNSRLDDPFRRVLMFREGEPRQLAEPLPPWAQLLLA